MAAAEKLTLLFLCTGNSCRSQMAEGFARSLLGSDVAVFSAGTRPHSLDRRAVTVMAEAGIDISGHYAKSLEELPGVKPDFVVTVCDSAAGTCPRFPGKANVLHRSFDDPPNLSKNANSEEEALAHYRRVRDEIRDFVVEDLRTQLFRGSHE